MALVPIYNILAITRARFATQLERLYNFFAGHSSSLLAKLVDQLLNFEALNRYSDIRDCNFLLILLTGDLESLLASGQTRS